MIKITKEQKDMLWGWDWPYSEAKLIFETRILDNEISRRFISVEITINPTTFKICKDNIEKFSPDNMISQILEHSQDRWKQDWYVSMAFSSPVDKSNEEKIIKEAKSTLNYAEQTVIKMHSFVMDFLDIKN